MRRSDATCVVALAFVILLPMTGAYADSPRMTSAPTDGAEVAARPGDRLRIRPSTGLLIPEGIADETGHRIVGDLTKWTVEALVLRPARGDAEELTIAVSDLREVELRTRGNMNRVVVAGFGILSGALIGSIVASNEYESPPCEGFCFDVDGKIGAGIRGGILGGAVGFATSLVLVNVFDRTRWDSIYRTSADD